MKTLTELSIKFDPDKRPNYHNYMPMYDRWLGDRLVGGKELKSLMEIGLLRGQSARMWEDYFPNASILMMDDYSQGRPSVMLGRRFQFVEGNSTRRETWVNVPDDLDVIIDDGSHLPEDQINTFMWGFQHIRPGGYYFIEDTYINFDEAFSPRDILYPWLMGMVVSQTKTRTDPVPYGDFYKVRDKLTWPESDIYAYHLYRSVIMFEKAL